ncbi:hypothetical protein V1477_021091 [Vespula maculifrons]|uniref:Uncharacterized protein n=1 Tax=Vespula maculifrons TaxID=7453 RepID=A0ABD2AH48_VESMC
MWRGFIKLGTVVRENRILSKDPNVNGFNARINQLIRFDRDLVIMDVCSTYRERYGEQIKGESNSNRQHLLRKI